MAIGGGTGLSTVLRGLKAHTKNITAVVTMADDGGGSGRLRSDLGMPPPGDIRNCLLALANTEPLMERLLSYRFSEGELAGQSFGNLFLAALNGVSGSFEEAVAQMSQVLAITGQVLPVTKENIRLKARFENGREIIGESHISDAKREAGCRIARVSLIPEHPQANPAVLEAIARADLILLGPGSLYTSVIPNLLVQGVSEAIAASRGLRIYICNVMTQEGETEGYTAADHLRALQEHGGGGLVDFCLANSGEIPERLLPNYLRERAVPLQVDRDAVEALGVRLALAPLSDEKHRHYARHDSTLLGAQVLKMLETHTIQTVKDGEILRQRCI